MTRQKLFWAILFASAGYATVPAQAVTTVYLSAQASGALPVMGLSLIAMAVASLAGALRRRKADSSAAFQSLPTRS
ncbi:MAG TPA: hypothetical protein VGK58_02415 [Lacipirellulaceae bacterium]